MARTNDIYGMPSQLAEERDRLDTAVDDGLVSDADRTAIIEFDQYRDVQKGVSNNTRYSDCKHLRVAAETSDDPLVDLEESGVTSVLSDIKYRRGEDDPLAPETMHKYRLALRKFYRHLGREFADTIDATVNTNQTTDGVDADDLLTGEDVDAMIQAARSVRDEAVIEMLADTCARISLLGTLRVQDVSLDTNRPTFSPNPNAEGLKNVPNKPYPLIDSPAVLRRYLNRKHPRSDDPDAPFFHKHAEYYDADDPTDDGAIGYDAIYSQLERIAERAGVEKPTNPHNFRHTAITRMRGDDAFDDNEIRHRAGWTKDTAMWGQYDHLEADTLNENLFVRTGVVEAEDGDETTRAPCRNCGTMNRTDRRYCGQCGAAVSREARAAFDEIESGAEAGRTETDDPARAILYERLADSLGMDVDAVEKALE